MSEEKKVEEEVVKEEVAEEAAPPILDDVVEAAPVEAKAEEVKAEEKVEEEKKPSVEDLQKELEAARAAAEEAKAALEAAQKEKAPEVKEQTVEDQYFKEFNERPSEAVLNLMARKEREKARKEELAYTQAVLAEASKGKIAGWEDFPELMKTMPAIVNKYGSIVNPDKENSLLTLEALTLIARGIAASQKGVEKSDKTAKDFAKEAAMMETDGGGGNGVDKDFADLTLEEMRARIPLQQL